MAAAIEGNIHIVPMPRWGSFVGLARFLIAIFVLTLVAAATGIWGGFTAFEIALFTASATLIIFTYYFIALSRKPILYNRWAVLCLEIFGVTFWLISFVHCAYWTSVYNGTEYWYTGDSYGFWNAPFAPGDVGLQKRELARRSGLNQYKVGISLVGTAAGLGAIEFVLFLVTLVTFSINLHKHRRAGQATVFGRIPKSATAEAAVAEKTASKQDADKAEMLKKDSSLV